MRVRYFENVFETFKIHCPCPGSNKLEFLMAKCIQNKINQEIILEPNLRK